MAVADVNGDGKPDIVSAGYITTSRNQVFVKLAGDGKGGLKFLQSSEVNLLPAGTMISCMAVADFNGDGTPDILRGLNNGGPYLVGTAAEPIQGTLSGGSDSFAVGDFNGDGKLDFASVGKPGISVQLGHGTGTFTESFSAALTHASQQYVSAGDFNGDGKLDLAVGNPSGVTVLLGDGTGKFTMVTGSPFMGIGPDHGNLTVADFNGDGKPDLASASSLGVAILLGDGMGKFAVAPGSPFAANLGSTDAPTAVGDFNADGVPDLVLGSNASPNVTVLLNDGTGKFTAAASVRTGTWARLLAVADFNGDGMPDIAAQHKFFTTGVLHWKRLGDADEQTCRHYCQPAFADGLCACGAGGAVGHPRRGDVAGYRRSLHRHLEPVLAQAQSSVRRYRHGQPDDKGRGATG